MTDLATSFTVTFILIIIIIIQELLLLPLLQVHYREAFDGMKFTFFDHENVSWVVFALFVYCLASPVVGFFEVVAETAKECVWERSKDSKSSQKLNVVLKQLALHSVLGSTKFLLSKYRKVSISIICNLQLCCSPLIRDQRQLTKGAKWLINLNLGQQRHHVRFPFCWLGIQAGIFTQQHFRLLRQVM